MRYTMCMRRVLYAIPTILFFALPFATQAQQATSTEAPNPALPAATTLGAGAANCFDFYRFGSISTNVVADLSGAVSGTPITFSGTIHNDNPYPIVDGALYVKVMRARTSVDGSGPDVVDQFLVQSNIAIPAKGDVPVSFSWMVPAYAQSGDYSLSTYFTTSRKFNLSGLSFTDDVVGTIVPFTVSGEQAGSVGFDKSAVQVQGREYHFAAFPPRESATGAVEVTAMLENTTGADAVANIGWTVYQWDAQLRQNVVQEVAPSALKIPAGTRVPVSIPVTDSKYPVYLVVGTATWKDTKSIIGVRFVRDGVDRTRINFPGVLSYPLKAGESNTLFSCVHNTGTSSIVPGGRLELTVSDMRGRPIASYTYEGGVTGDMMGVANTFVPTRSYDSFKLDARLYQGDTYVDEAHLVYDCAALGGTDCTPQPGENGFDWYVLLQDPRILFGGGAVLALVFLSLTLSALRSSRTESATPSV